MTNRDPRYRCLHCQKIVRQIGKHTNQKHPGLVVMAERVEKKKEG